MDVMFKLSNNFCGVATFEQLEICLAYCLVFAEKFEQSMRFW